MDVIDFVKKYPIKSFTKGESLLSEGSISDTLLAIRTGYVKVTSIDDLGNERMLWIAGRYDIVPTERLFSQRSPLQFFYTALSDGELFQIKKSDFLSKAKEDVKLMAEIATGMSGHYDDLLSRIDTIGQSSIRDKLIATLRYVAQRFSADQSVDLYQLGLHMTHKDLADMIGSTRETTSLELHKLRTAGMIEYDRTRFIVHTDKCTL
ncbi:MAG: CarD family transcriptional regulator [Candidatus Saccharibacteria bacterium]|jgi:CRP/FNR family cyclic AMP-dependent transcriptional regulator|nr:CarD family transcriptional regulator [Candidatus Saccharibacteria bacterium]